MKYILFLFLICSSLFSMANNLKFKDGLEQKFKGNVSENFMHDYFKKSGWKQLSGEIGSNGIDGLYIKKNRSGVIIDVMCAESKFNKSTLGTINKGLTKQMSKKWCLSKLDNLIKNGDSALKKDYKIIRERVKNNNVKKRLFKVLQNSSGKYTVQVKNIVDDGLHNVKVKNLIGSQNYKINNKEINTNYAKNSESKNFKNLIKQETSYFKEREWATSKIKRVTNIRATKTIFKTSSSVALKTGIKGVSKGLFAGIAKHLPYVGVVAQIAFDSYVTYQLETQGEDIKKNRQVIQANRDYIVRLQKEQEILDYKITNNTHNINKIINQLFIYDEHFNQIDTQISGIIEQIVSLENLISTNKQEIESIKNGAFVHSIDKFDEYYQRKTKKEILISEVINSFEFAQSIKNEKISYLINYYLTIARYEQYLQTHDSFDLIKIKENFDELYKYVEKNNQFLDLLNNTYSIVYEIDTKRFKNKLDNITQIIVEKKLKNLQFEEALSVINNYLITIKANKANPLYIKVIRARLNNYEKYKNFNYYEDTKIIDKYSNNLLNKKAVKFLYQNDYYEKALEILRSKSFDSEDFRLEYFIKIYYYLGEKEKLNKLLNLIIKNTTYSEKIKKFAISVQKKY